MSTLRARQETHTLEARSEAESPRDRLASAWILCDVTAPGPKEPGRPRRTVNVALVLDRSGSMNGKPLELARQGALLAVEALRGSDRFGVVVYDDRVDVLLPSLPATEGAKSEARARLGRVHSGGSTDLHAGWLQGCEEVALGMTAGAESRCLLLTDGLANQGVTDHGEIARRAAELHARGIVTSTFGLGDGFDEVLLQKMAEAGGGNAYWVREPEQIGPAMAAEMGDSLEVVARGVTLVVEGPGVEEVLVPGLGRLTRGPDGRFRRSLGSLSASQVRSETLHVRLRRRRPGRKSAVTVWLEDADGALPREAQELVYTFQPREVADAAPLDADVVVATRTSLVQGLAVAALGPDAMERAKEWIAKLDREAGRLARLESRVPGIAAVLGELRETADRLADQKFLLDSGRVKEAMYAASYGLKGRDAAGRARYSRGGGRLLVQIHGDAIDVSAVAALLHGAFRDAVRGGMSCIVIAGEPVAATGPDAEPMSRTEQRHVALRIGTPLAGRPVTLLVTPRPLEGNRFSTWHASPRAAVVSLHRDGRETTAPVEAFLAYEAILHGLRFVPEWDPETLMHAETRGCVFDFCGVRSDLDVKLHAASLCDPCREALRRSRVDTGLVDALLSVVRDLAASPRAGVS